MAKRALIVIDVQHEYLDGALPISDPPLETSLANIGRAMDAATAQGVPVIIVRHTDAEPDAAIFREGSHAWELLPEVAQRPRDHLVEKTLPGSFTGTALGEILAENAVDTVSITGYMTHMCVDTTSRQAAHRGPRRRDPERRHGNARAREQRRHGDRRGAAPRHARRAGPVLRRRAQHRGVARARLELTGSVSRARRRGRRPS